MSIIKNEKFILNEKFIKLKKTIKDLDPRDTSPPTRKLRAKYKLVKKLYDKKMVEINSKNCSRFK